MATFTKVTATKTIQTAHMASAKQFREVCNSLPPPRLFLAKAWPTGKLLLQQFSKFFETTTVPLCDCVSCYLKHHFTLHTSTWGCSLPACPLTALTPLRAVPDRPEQPPHKSAMWELPNNPHAVLLRSLIWSLEVQHKTNFIWCKLKWNTSLLIPLFA